MPGRSFATDKYRFGFNGKEKDAEGMGGGGSTYDYGFRIYNPQIAKFLSVDPLTKSYPWYTPYQFAGNMPIWAIDLDGLEEQIVVDNTHPNGGQPDITTLNAEQIKNSNANQVLFVKYMREAGLVDECSTIHFKLTSNPTLKRVGAELVFSVTYNINWDGNSLTNIEIPFFSVGIIGGHWYDYPLVLVGSGAYSNFLNKIQIPKMMNGMVSQMFSKYYGTSRGQKLEALAAFTKYQGWTWLDNIASNFPAFDFMKGNTFASFKTTMSSTFKKSDYIGFVDKIALKVKEGFTFKSKPYNPSSGVLDILVPQNQLDDFIKEGGKHYNAYKELIKYGADNNVTVSIGSKVLK